VTALKAIIPQQELQKCFKQWVITLGYSCSREYFKGDPSHRSI